MSLHRMFRHAASALALSSLVACVQARDTTVEGQERVDECVATACATLDLDGLGLRDYGQLSALSHVTSLMVSHTNLADLGAVAGMGQLSELHLGYVEASDLSGLAAFENLRLVHMQGVSAQAVASARFPASLRELAVGGAGLTDLSIVHRAPGLERLHIGGGTTLADLSALEGHGALRTVHLGYIGDMELAPLLALPGLREVSLEFNTGGPHPAQAAVIAQLRARGVSVSAEEIAFIIC